MRTILRSLALALAAPLALFAGSSAAMAMTFDLVSFSTESCGDSCPKLITATGEIELDSDAAFIRFVQTRVLPEKVASTVLMASPGGNLVGSLKLGMAMRQLGFSIMVGQVHGGGFMTARCLSACAYALAGGKTRIVPQGSHVGVHRAWTKRRGQRDIVDGGGSIEAQVSTEGYSPVLERYLQMMGVSRQLVALADRTPSADIRILSREELSKFRVVTPEKRTGRRRS